MKKFSFFSGVMEAVNHSKNSAMEADTISKHGRISKSHTSRGNFLSKACFVLLAGFIVFNGCDKDNNDNGGDDGNGGTGGSGFKITATNVINGSTLVTTVKALADDDAIAQAPYKNNGFTLELPETVPSKYLELIAEELPDGVTISNENLKILYLYDIVGYDEDEDEIGFFYLVEENEDSEYYTSWMYADSNATIKGEDKDTDGDDEYIEKYDFNLKKGWNVVYEIYTESYNDSTEKGVYTSTFTSQKPSGVTFTWNFYQWK